MQEEEAGKLWGVSAIWVILWLLSPLYHDLLSGSISVVLLGVAVDVVMVAVGKDSNW